MNLKQGLLIAIVFGLVAAAVVWWLERFEVNKLHGEIMHYMKNQSAFEEWLKERGQTE